LFEINFKDDDYFSTRKTLAMWQDMVDIATSPLNTCITSRLLQYYDSMTIPIDSFDVTFTYDFDGYENYDYKNFI